MAKRPPHDPARKKKISQAMTGVPKTLQHREAMSKSQKERRQREKAEREKKKPT